VFDVGLTDRANVFSFKPLGGAAQMITGSGQTIYDGSGGVQLGVSGVAKFGCDTSAAYTVVNFPLYINSPTSSGISDSMLVVRSSSTAGNILKVCGMSGPTTGVVFEVNASSQAKVNGTLSVSGGIVGTTTNDLATAGNYGEYISSAPLVVAHTGSGQYVSVGKITLTAGDWDISACIYMDGNGATVTGWKAGIGTADGNSSTGLIAGSNYTAGALLTNEGGISIPTYRVSIASSTDYYLKSYAAYSVAVPQNYGRISARRVR
jgi:hypothetical protein